MDKTEFEKKVDYLRSIGLNEDDIDEIYDLESDNDQFDNDANIGW